jgi:aryl-alcohol dehydrogenase-like predicted oxidoreductase
VRNRNLIGGWPPVSIIGLDIGAMRAQQAPGPDSSVVALVRRAFALGINLMDLSTGYSPAGNRALLSQALGPDISRAVTLVKGRNPLPPPSLATTIHWGGLPVPDFGAAPADLVGQPPNSLPLLSPDLFTASPTGAVDETRDSEGGDLPGSPRAWGLDLPAGAVENASWSEAVRRGARLFHLEANLLELQTLQASEISLAAKSIPLVISNPHAHGLLDGGWLEAGGLNRLAPKGPLEWRGLQERLAPITRLGFLTVGRGRTLAVAAVQALLESPSIASVAIAPRDLEGLELLANPEDWPPLTADERGHLGRWRAGRPATDA